MDVQSFSRNVDCVANDRRSRCTLLLIRGSIVRRENKQAEFKCSIFSPIVSPRSILGGVIGFRPKRLPQMDQWRKAHFRLPPAALFLAFLLWFSPAAGSSPT